MLTNMTYLGTILSKPKSTLLLGSTILAALAYYYFLIPSRSKDDEVMYQRDSKRKKLPPLKDRKTVEVCISDIESALNAIQGGANSLELCANRPEGGTTPNIGFVEECVNLCRSLDVQVHILIRPRPGDFVYSKREFEVIERDIAAVKAAGADGIVCGIMNKKGGIDMQRMNIVRELSRDMQLTFHRAFDLCSKYQEAIEDIITIGCDRLLTSGLEKFAHQSADGKLKHIVQLCEGQIHVIAASGITPENVVNIIKKSNVPGVHAGGGMTRMILSSINIDPSLETPLFTLAAEMKVWKRIETSLVAALADESWAVWTDSENSHH